MEVGLARLGLRGGEVRQLRLEDIDWNEGLIHIRRSKTYRERSLPLPSDVGAVLTDYDRPQSPYRGVFLTASTPHVPLTTATTVTFITRRFLERIGLHGRSLGTHCSRQPPWHNSEGRVTAELTAHVGSRVMGEHRNPALVDRFTVLEGELTVKLKHKNRRIHRICSRTAVFGSVGLVPRWADNLRSKRL